VIFVPGADKVVYGCLNLWQGWGVEERRGDWSLIRAHIREVVAGGNKVFGDYVEYWIAWAIQHPAEQAEVALVLIGLKGVGKGTLVIVRCLQRIFGPHAFQVTSREEVIGRFNAHLQDCVLFIADEAYWGGDKRCVGRLQGMITEETLPIERKGIEINEGGAEAMFYDLQRLDLGDFHPRDIPEAVLKGEALQKQQGFSLPPLEQWFVSLLHDGVLPGAGPKRPNTTFTSWLLIDAKDRIPRLKWDLSEVLLRNFLIDEEAVGIPCTKYRSSVGNGWSFAPLKDLREAWCRRYGSIKWDNPDAEWNGG
jgi:hypothetical protein